MPQMKPFRSFYSSGVSFCAFRAFRGEEPLILVVPREGPVEED